MEWLLSNLPSILVAAVLVGVIAAIVVSIVKKKKSGGGCHGNCASCPHCSSKQK